jgi:hypothetical protein
MVASVEPLCLVGMSGVGKSFWSKRLAERGWTTHDCDARIASRLAELVSPAPGEEPVHALGRWMGMPWSAGYPTREEAYLRLESQVTRAALEACREGHVLDTTGSVVSLDAKLLRGLPARPRVGARAHAGAVQR